MNEKLRAKYTAYNEPRKAFNNARFKNCTQWSGGKSGNQGKSRTKTTKPSGFSGKTVGNMLRQMTLPSERKKR